MLKSGLSRTERKRLDELVNHYMQNQDNFTQFLEQLRGLFLGEKNLIKHIHSIKWRVKDPEHLRQKLIKKLKETKQSGKSLAITKENLFQKINDLVGVRILHLHTKQMQEIDNAVKKLFLEQRYQILNGPIAKTWDDESRDYFTGIGFKTEKSPSLYTSVHYEIRESSRRKYTFELQVRTLMEEVWGEVDHVLNYPDPSTKLSCREQIKVLARATSTCSRLVDSIFKTSIET
ncbi:MAG: RelA/SpoT domain-containing protein [Nitrososphaerales archaeon]